METANPLERNVLIFDRPFAYIVNNPKACEYCYFCLRKPDAPKKLQFCAKCRHARYCDRSCQRLGWFDHKPECARLVSVFPNLPMTEVMFLGRIVDKLNFIAKNGDNYGFFKYRRFDTLVGHHEEIKALKATDPETYRFDKIYGKIQKYFGEAKIDEDYFFDVFCRTSINSHSIHNSSSEEIGMALDLGVSRYNHSCRPNSALVFDGYKAMIRSLVPGLDLHNTHKTFISYIDVGRSRYQRQKELKEKWFFDCECVRCSDPEDDAVTSIKCPNGDCGGSVLVTEISDPKGVKCPKCLKDVQEEFVVKCQDFMKTLPARFLLDDSEANVKLLKGYLLQARDLLSVENIYYGRLLTAYTNVCYGNDPEVINPDMHKMVCNNFRRCFPSTDRHVGYQLLHIVAALIRDQRREEAIPYAYEAMTIFEVCFGLEHPFYLQTLALWTYLDQGSEKTDDQLLGLMDFRDNKPVDIGRFLQMDEGDNPGAKQAIQNGEQKEQKATA